MRQWLTKFVGEPRDPAIDPDRDLFAELLDGLAAACKSIATLAVQGTLGSRGARKLSVDHNDESPTVLDVLAKDIVIDCCAGSGILCGMVSHAMAEPYRIPSWRKQGPYLLVFEPFEGSMDVDVGMTAGTIFSILRAPENRSEPAIEDFLQPGTRQIAAGYGLYGPASMLVITLGAGVQGFTLDDNGAFLLTHPDLRIPEAAREFAINVSNRRFWEPPVYQYVEECLDGKAGLRGADFDMRWTASLVAEVHRILIRGGIIICPRDSMDPSKSGPLRLMYEANPLAMLVEQAGGAASTGRKRILDLKPQSLHQQIPAFLGSRLEVQRLVRYHEAFDRGEALAFETPLFHARSLFRSA